MKFFLEFTKKIKGNKIIFFVCVLLCVCLSVFQALYTNRVTTGDGLPSFQQRSDATNGFKKSIPD